MFLMFGDEADREFNKSWSSAIKNCVGFCSFQNRKRRGAPQRIESPLLT